MKFSNFMNSLLTNLMLTEIKLTKIFRLKFMLKRTYLSQYLIDSTNECLKLKLECLEIKNSYILLIDVINFKLRLINFIYLF